MPGQFLIAKIDEQGERIPLNICDYDREKGTVTTVVQEVGVKLIDVGASYSYHKNPDDSNIRIAPSYPNINDLETAPKVFVRWLSMLILINY